MASKKNKKSTSKDADDRVEMTLGGVLTMMPGARDGFAPLFATYPGIEEAVVKLAPDEDEVDGNVVEINWKPTTTEVGAKTPESGNSTSVAGLTPQAKVAETSTPKNEDEKGAQEEKGATEEKDVNDPDQTIMVGEETAIKVSIPNLTPLMYYLTTTPKEEELKTFKEEDSKTFCTKSVAIVAKRVFLGPECCTKVEPNGTKAKEKRRSPIVLYEKEATIKTAIPVSMRKVKAPSKEEEESKTACLKSIPITAQRVFLGPEHCAKIQRLDVFLKQTLMVEKCDI